MIASINNGRSVAFYTERKRQCRMVQIARFDRDIFDDKAPLAKVVVAHRRPECLGRYREIGIFHLAGQGLLERLAKPLWSVNIPFVSRDEERREKGNALDVIPMGMADQHMPARGLAFAQDGLPKFMTARSAVDHQPRARSCQNFDA